MAAALKLRHHALHLVKGLALGLVVAGGIVGSALGVFIGSFGWQRFLADFWPLDNSRVGPNLCASVAVVVLVTGLNEYKTAVRAVEAGERLAQIARDVRGDVLRPIRSVEESIAQDIKEDA